MTDKTLRRFRRHYRDREETVSSLLLSPAVLGLADGRRVPWLLAKLRHVQETERRLSSRGPAGRLRSSLSLFRARYGRGHLPRHVVFFRDGGRLRRWAFRATTVAGKLLALDLADVPGVVAVLFQADGSRLARRRPTVRQETPEPARLDGRAWDEALAHAKATASRPLGNGATSSPGVWATLARLARLDGRQALADHAERQADGLGGSLASLSPADRAWLRDALTDEVARRNA